MCQLPKPILLNYKRNYVLSTQISIVNRTFFKTQHTIMCFIHKFQLLSTLSTQHYTPSSLLCTLHQCQNLLVFRQNTLLFNWQNFHFKGCCAILNQSFSNMMATGELLVWRTIDGNIEVKGDQKGRGVRVRGGGGGGRGGRRERARRKAIISYEIRATVVNPVVNHGLTMQEAGQRVQPNISRFSVASILWTFRRGNR